MNFLKYAVRDGRVHVLDSAQYECRGDNARRILDEMVKRAPERFEGRRGTMIFNDRPPEPHEELEGDLNFCSTKWVGRPSRFLPMACPYSLGWPHVGISDGDALIRFLLAHDPGIGNAAIFWIGADTHRSRAKLCEMSRQYPDRIQANLMRWGRHDGQVELSPIGGYASLPDHARHKYLIDCPGRGYSGRLRWLLATGRPVFIVERPWVEHWHESLVPWKHFVPVREDLSDLLDARQALENDGNLCRDIGRNARAFVRERLTFDREIEFNIRALMEAALGEQPVVNAVAVRSRTSGA